MHPCLRHEQRAQEYVRGFNALAFRLADKLAAKKGRASQPLSCFGYRRRVRQRWSPYGGFRHQIFLDSYQPYLAHSQTDENRIAAMQACFALGLDRLGRYGPDKAKLQEYKWTSVT